MKKLISIFCLSLLLTGCASTVQYVKYNLANDETYTKIYVIRPTSYSAAVKMSIYQDDKLIGKLGAKSFLSWEVDPSKGEIRIISKSENRDMVTINPKAGKTYYIKQQVKMGWVTSRTGLEFLEEEEAKEMLLKLKKPQMKYAE